MKVLPPLGAGDEYELRSPNPDLGCWDEKTEAWRLHRFVELGFPLRQAEQLARGRTWPGHVEAWLDAGCTHAQAIEIGI